MPTDVEHTWRVSPGGASITERLLFLRHLFAYEHAITSSATRGLAVDLASGSGYGVSLLAESFKAVVAIDLADASLAQLSSLPRTHRVRANAARIPLRDSSADLVIAFQLLEHVDVETGVAVLREMRRVLRPGGIGFCTTPNANLRLLPGQDPWNPFHVVEYRPDSIRALCDRAGLPGDAISGIAGDNGAQEVEEARVRWSWPSAQPTSLRMRVAQALYKARRRFERASPGAPLAMPENARSQDYYRLSNDVGRCIDFLLRIPPATDSPVPTRGISRDVR
jgi:SAM-dependent methyltransferase